MGPHGVKTYSGPALSCTQENCRVKILLKKKTNYELILADNIIRRVQDTN